MNLLSRHFVVEVVLVKEFYQVASLAGVVYAQDGGTLPQGLPI